MSDKPLVVVGLPPWTEQAAAVARMVCPGRDVSVAELAVERKLKIDFSPLALLDPQLCEVFVTLDNRAVNFSRLEIFSMLKARGFAMARLIASGAFVGPDQRFGENTIIHVGAAVSPDARVGYNVVIGPGCSIGGGVRIGNSAYLGAGAVVATGATIGDNATIAAGVTIEAGVKVGKQSEILIPGVYAAEIPEKTFYAPGFTGPVRIVKF